MPSKLSLATNREALAPILIPAAADRVTRFAAAELARYLEEITGAEFRVQEARDGAAVPPPRS